jgi:hypothetical protein
MIEIEEQMKEIHRLTGKWSQPGVPHKGWSCIDIEDLGEPSKTCEMCETQPIRYIHHMQHPGYPEVLCCGCVCAGHMEDDYTEARRRENTIRNAGARRSRWLQRNWRLSQTGNPFLNADGYNIVVYPAGEEWKFRVTNRKTNYFINSRKLLATTDAAKLRAFDAIIWMKERGQ